MASTTIQRFAAKAGLIASRYTPGEERNIVGTYANNLKERLEELDELVRNAPSFKKCKHDKTLETFWIANVPKFITYQESSATCEYLDTVYWGDAIFPTTRPNHVSYDCITIKLGNGGYWCVGSGMQHRAAPAPETIRECINTFYEKPQTERPKYFSAEDSGDKVLKQVAEYMKTTQGGYINLEQAREIVIQSMFEVGVLSESEEGIIESLRFTDYKEDIGALEPPKESDEEHENPEVEVEPSALAVSVKPPQIAATITSLVLMALGTLILSWYLFIR